MFLFLDLTLNVYSSLEGTPNCSSYDGFILGEQTDLSWEFYCQTFQRDLLAVESVGELIHYYSLRDRVSGPAFFFNSKLRGLHNEDYGTSCISALSRNSIHTPAILLNNNDSHSADLALSFFYGKSLAEVSNECMDKLWSAYLEDLDANSFKGGDSCVGYKFFLSYIKTTFNLGFVSFKFYTTYPSTYTNMVNSAIKSANEGSIAKCFYYWKFGYVENRVKLLWKVTSPREGFWPDNVYRNYDWGVGCRYKSTPRRFLIKECFKLLYNLNCSQLVLFDILVNNRVFYDRFTGETIANYSNYFENQDIETYYKNYRPITPIYDYINRMTFSEYSNLPRLYKESDSNYALRIRAFRDTEYVKLLDSDTLILNFSSLVNREFCYTERCEERFEAFYMFQS